jgi:hypothetical protein
MLIQEWDMKLTSSIARTKGILGATVAVVLFAGSTFTAGATIYDINRTILGGSVTGTIQTDGATGVLSASDITGWNLTLNGVGASYNITNSNSSNRIVGSDVTATSTDLFFNFSGTDGGYLLFQQGVFSGNHYYCASTALGACFQGETVAPQNISDSSAQHDARSGNVVIANAAVGTTPLPSTWTMLLGGLAAVGFAAYRGSKRSTAT